MNNFSLQEKEDVLKVIGNKNINSRIVVKLLLKSCYQDQHFSVKVLPAFSKLISDELYPKKEE